MGIGVIPIEVEIGDNPPGRNKKRLSFREEVGIGHYTGQKDQYLIIRVEGGIGNYPG